MKTAIIVIVVLVIVGLGIWYFASQGTNTNYGTTNTANTNTTTTNITNTNTKAASPVANSGSQDVADYAIDMGEYSFSPNKITVEPGETIRLKVKNTGTTSHDFVIDELGINSGLIAPGQEKTIAITGSKMGTFDVYCSVSGHRSLGMEGTIEVKQQ